MGFWLLALLAMVLSAQSNQADAGRRLRQGVEAQQRGNMQAAAEEFRQAVALDRANPEAQARLGMAYQSLGMLPEAAAALAQALKIAPDLPGVGLLLAFTYLDMGKNRDAVPYLSKAIDSEKELSVRILAGQRLVDAYFASGDFEGGLDTVERLRKLAPDDPNVLYTASKVYANLWNSTVERLVNTAPGSYRVHQVFAEVFEAQDRFADAAKEYRQIIQMEPNLPGAHYRLGRMILRTGDTPENDKNALAEFRKELEIRPEDVPAFVEIGGIDLRAQRLDEAEKDFSRALKLQPESVGALTGLAKVYLGRKQYSQALEPLQRAVALAPGDETIHYNLMVAYRSLGRAAEAQRAYGEFQKIKTRQQESQAGLLKQLKGMPVEAQTPRQ